MTRDANSHVDETGADPGAEPGGLAVVAIGASAGGLRACRQLLEALSIQAGPGQSGAGAGGWTGGAAFILVQHQDPHHASMLVDLLSGHTAMPVRLAVDGAALEAGTVHVMPPGMFVTVSQRVLRLTPAGRDGMRLPFDVLLRSLAEAFGRRAACLVLSGTGADGSQGLSAVRTAGGLVIVQDPAEAEYDGMPRSAVQTGHASLILPIAAMPEALARFAGQAQRPAPGAAGLAEIVALLRRRTAHDFTLYKPGTLRRRVERRMTMAGLAAGEMAAYLARLEASQEELDLLAKDLLINVTSFFRDAAVFDALAASVIPAMVAAHGEDEPLRVWVAGCSTGEETYSLVMLLRERIAAEGRHLKLQVFASDIDPEAVAVARAGLYPHAIEAEVSPERLARFFAREPEGYRFLPDLRASVVFAVQDVLTDPPFSRMDLVSCRNLLIYLRAEAQAKVISLFHFALRPGGVLLLGGAEAITHPEGRFEVIAKSARLYRRIGRGTPGATGFAVPAAWAVRAEKGQAPGRRAGLAELCRRLVDERFSPAAVLINRRQECLFTMGPTDRYLRIAPGHPTVDLPSMARQETRIRLRTAIQRAWQGNARVVVPGGRITHQGVPIGFAIDVQPLTHGGESLLLICFVETGKAETGRGAGAEEDPSRIAELERELEAARGELQEAVRNLDIAAEEQKAVDEETLSVNEEYQSTNEELLTSKEELQSLNEELNALNSQLQETLDRQRTTANDLRNVLFSTDVATLFLDGALNIRFFTPATRALFNIIPGDIGRRLADLRALVPDAALLEDARAVLAREEPIEAEIPTGEGGWYLRRILPYRTQEEGVAGVVITFSDITERHAVAEAQAAAKRAAELANTAKSRFLAAASHDLRQPLQTMTLLQGLLARKVSDPPARLLVERFGATLQAMSGMLDTLLDTNRIEAGVVDVMPVSLRIDLLFTRLRAAFSLQAQARGIGLHVVPCGLTVRSDPRLLEQILRNLLANAIKYTSTGRVLLGCRRRGEMLRIEVWDTGIGIPPGDLSAIFEEYRQLDTATREDETGLGLGLSIVKRLAGLLGHRLAVRSNPALGSVFSVEVPVVPAVAKAPAAAGVPAEPGRRTGRILVVEDEADVRQLLELSLAAEGHAVMTAEGGAAALALLDGGGPAPDLLLVDFNLPHGLNGVELAAAMRAKLRRDVPALVLTGDISTGTLRGIAAHNLMQLSKPVHPAALAVAVQALLPASGARAAPPPPMAPGVGGAGVVHVIDDDPGICGAIRMVLEGRGRRVATYGSGEAYFAAAPVAGVACVLIDAGLPGISGFEVLRRIVATGGPPCIMITGDSDVSMAVEAMRNGAMDFIEKPFGDAELAASVERALERAHDGAKNDAWRRIAADHIAGLTPRQYEIMTLVLAGAPSKNIAADLGISQRTVENHRAAIMKKTGSRSLPALARLAIAASAAGAVPPA